MLSSSGKPQAIVQPIYNTGGRDVGGALLPLTPSVPPPSASPSNSSTKVSDHQYLPNARFGTYTGGGGQSLPTVPSGTTSSQSNPPQLLPRSKTQSTSVDRLRPAKTSRQTNNSVSVTERNIRSINLNDLSSPSPSPSPSSIQRSRNATPIVTQFSNASNYDHSVASGTYTLFDYFV